MFASATYASSDSRAHGAYAHVQASRAESATPHRLVGMLFDGVIDALSQAQGAIASGAVDVKCRAIVRAVRIVEEGLITGLNLKDGGPLAENLSALYDYITVRMTQANLHNDTAALEECKQLIDKLRSAWEQIDAPAAR